MYLTYCFILEEFWKFVKKFNSWENESSSLANFEFFSKQDILEKNIIKL